MRFECFRKLGLRGRRWYFRLVAGNGEPIGQSEGYANKGDMERTIRLIMSESPVAEIRYV